MEEIKRLRKQLAEMRRLGQSQTVIGSEKYRELIAQVYAELKKLGGPRLPSAKEWAEAAGVDAGSILKLRRIKGMEKFPIGYDVESFMKGRKKASKQMLAKNVTGVRRTGDKVIGVTFRNLEDKKKVKDILTEYSNAPLKERNTADAVKKLRSIKDLKSLKHGSMVQFILQARKDLNIKLAVVTEAVALHRPANVSEHILRSLTEHIRQGGTDFKYAPKGEATVYGQLKIIDNKTGDVLTRDSIREAIKNNDPRFREYATRWKQLKDLKKTPFTHPVTGTKMTLLNALQEGTGNPAPLHLDHIRGVKTSPLNDLQVSTWKGNQAKKLDLTTKEAKLFGVKTVVKGGTSIVGPDISLAKRESDLIKFATDLFLKGGTREVLKPKAHLDQFIAIVKSTGSCGHLVKRALGGATVATCAEIIKAKPVESAQKLLQIKESTGAINKVKNAAAGFLKLAGRVGTKAAPLAALAAVGAGIEPLIKKFFSLSRDTYRKCCSPC